jgi:hypothetical protein
MADMLRAKETFTFEGVEYTIGQLVAADDPVAQGGRGRLFEPVEPAKRRRRET